MKAALALAAAATATLFARVPHYARALLRPLGGRVDQNSAGYYAGYRGSDFDVPWAKYFNDSTIVLNQEFIDGLEVLSPTPFHDERHSLTTWLSAVSSFS